MRRDTPNCSSLLFSDKDSTDDQARTEMQVFAAATIDEALSTLVNDGHRGMCLMLIDSSMLKQYGGELKDCFQHHRDFRSLPCVVLADVLDTPVISQIRDAESGGKGLDIRTTVSRHAAAALINAIQAVIAGRAYCNSLSNVRPSDASVSTLTIRQREIIALVLKGYSNKKIASALDLSYGTVKNYMYALMKQLSVNSRLELAAKMRADSEKHDLPEVD